MKEKYYNPELEEFHIGFEYEWFNWKGWDKQIFYIGHPSIVYHHYTHTFKNKLLSVEETYRVKYLDENDILELGWTKHNRWESYYFDVFTLCFDGNKRENVTIFIDAVEATHPNYLFEGYCKNKSVLKQLMKMLNII